MTDRWLTLADAAARIGRSRRTMRAWVQAGDLVPVMGRVRESDLLRVEQERRHRMLAGRSADTPE